MCGIDRTYNFYNTHPNPSLNPLHLGPSSGAYAIFFLSIYALQESKSHYYIYKQKGNIYAFPHPLLSLWARFALDGLNFSLVSLAI